MRVCIAGSRGITEVGYILIGLEVSGISFDDISEIVVGGAKGIDTEAEKWAIAFDLPVKKFIADWDKHGKAAGPIRNKQMAEYADRFVVVHNGSRGSASMMREARKLGKPVTEVKVGG